MRKNLAENRCLMGRSPKEMSFWGIFFAYQILNFCARPNGHASLPTELSKAIRESFRVINTRWNIAGIYLQLLEAQEAMS